MCAPWNKIERGRRRQGRDRDRRNKTASPAEESRVRAAHKHHSRTSPVLLYLDGKGLEQGELGFAALTDAVGVADAHDPFGKGEGALKAHHLDVRAGE